MSFSASIPVAQMQAANTELEELGFGPNNFSIPAFAGAAPTHALLHCWDIPGFEAAVAAIAGVVIEQDADNGDNPVAATTAAATQVGAKWGNDALPLTGTVSPGLHRDADNVLWWVIQSYNTATYPDPTVIPALIRRAKVPGDIAPWKQPTDQYDAYKLVNPFTGQPDRCMHNSQTWVVNQADGSGNNVWEPGVFGWVVV